MGIRSTPAVVPDGAGLAVGHRGLGAEHSPNHEGRDLPGFVEPDLPRRGDQRRSRQDGKGPSACPFRLLQSSREVDFFAGVLLQAETAHLAECIGFDKDERSRRESAESTDEVPDAGSEVGGGWPFVETDRASTGKDPTGLNRLEDQGQEGWGRDGVGVEEQDPLPVRSCGSGIACTADHVDRFKDDAGAVSPGNFRGAIRRVVVADDDLGGPGALMKGFERLMQGSEGCREESFLVEGRDDHRECHVVNIVGDGGFAKQRSVCMVRARLLWAEAGSGNLTSKCSGVGFRRNSQPRIFWA